MRGVASTALVVLAAAVVVWAARRAHADDGLEAVLPRNTLVFVVLDDAAAFGADVGEGAWGRYLADPAWDPARAIVSDGVARWSDRLGEQLGLAAGAVRGVDVGAVALSLVALAPDPVGDTGHLVLAAHAELRGGGPALERRLGALADALVEGGHFAARDADEGGRALYRDMGGEGGLELRFGLVDGALLATVAIHETEAADAGALAFAELAARWRGSGGAALGDDDAFRLSAAAGAPRGLRHFVDVPALVDVLFSLLERAGDDVGLAILEDVEVRELGPFSGFLVTGPDGTRSRSELPWTGSGRLPALLLSLLRPTSHATLALAPERAGLAVSVGVDALAGFDLALASIASVGETPAERVRELLLSFQHEFGMDLRDELVAALGDELVVAAVDRAGPAVGEERELCALVRLEEAEAVRVFVDRLLHGLGLHVGKRVEEYRGVELVHVPIGFGVGFSGAVLEDLLVVATSEDLAREILDRRLGAGAAVPAPAVGARAATRGEAVDAAVAAARPAVRVVQDAPVRAFNAWVERAAALAGALRVSFGGPAGAEGFSVPEFTGVEAPDAALGAEYFSRPYVWSLSLDPAGVAADLVGP